MTRELEQQVLAYLQDHNVMTLATVGPEGSWAAGLFYVNDGFDLYWLSNPDTRHSRNILHASKVAVTVHEDYREWRIIQGIQMEGTARQVGTLGQAGRSMKLYLAKYPFLGDPLEPTSALAKALAGMRVYRFTPTRVYFIDNSKGLGHREEVILSMSSVNR